MLKLFNINWIENEKTIFDFDENIVYLSSFYHI